jgi:hypothetical protein
MELLILSLSRLCILSGLVAVWWIISNQWRLRGIPGNAMARTTDLWRFWKARQGNIHQTYIEQHQKYGPLVRIGPNCVSVSGLEAISAIYNVTRKFSKVSYS